MSNNDMVVVKREVAEAAWQALDDDGRFEESCPLREALDQPAQQHQGEPVAWCQPHWSGKYADYCWGSERPNSPCPELWKPLYTHADPAEVERLRAQLHDLAMAIYKSHYAKTAPNFEPFDFASGLIGQIDNMVAGLLQDVSTLRGDVETMRRKNNEYWHESEAMRAQLAEAQALLQAVREARRVAHHYHSGNGMLDWIEGEAKRLSASAEPSAPACLTCKGSVLEYDSGAAHPCTDCKTSAPVDERNNYPALVLAQTGMRYINRRRSLPYPNGVLTILDNKEGE